MTALPAMYYVWLYLSQGAEALASLTNALSIPGSNVMAGDDAQAVSQDVNHLSESGLQHFALQGDFALSCDIRLAGWTLPAVQAVLQQLSANGLRIAMADNNSDSPFAFTLFESGNCRAITVVENDETNEVTMYASS
jgi:hypothetical protein